MTRALVGMLLFLPLAAQIVVIGRDEGQRRAIVLSRQGKVVATTKLGRSEQLLASRDGRKLIGINHSVPDAGRARILDAFLQNSAVFQLSHISPEQTGYNPPHSSFSPDGGAVALLSVKPDASKKIIQTAHIVDLGKQRITQSFEIDAGSDLARLLWMESSVIVAVRRRRPWLRIDISKSRISEVKNSAEISSAISVSGRARDAILVLDSSGTLVVARLASDGGGIVRSTPLRLWVGQLRPALFLNPQSNVAVIPAVTVGTVRQMVGAYIVKVGALATSVDRIAVETGTDGVCPCIGGDDIVVVNGNNARLVSLREQSVRWDTRVDCTSVESCMCWE